MGRNRRVITWLLGSLLPMCPCCDLILSLRNREGEVEAWEIQAVKASDTDGNPSCGGPERAMAAVGLGPAEGQARAHPSLIF